MELSCFEPFGSYYDNANETGKVKMETPQNIKTHQKDYKNKSWQDYTLQELGTWVHLLVKRSKHRDNPEKKAKDLYDAKNYLDMMQSHIDAAKQQ